MTFLLLLALLPLAPRSAPAEPLAPTATAAQLNLKQRFAPQIAAFGDQSAAKIKIESGPLPVKMRRQAAPGQTWQASLGDIHFKITIEDQTQLAIADTLDRLQRLPQAYWRAFAIVSEGTKDGVAFYADLGGAAAHGSQDYLNLIPKANAMVVAHEAGHILEQRASATAADTLALWKKAIAQDQISVSRYGDQVAHEDLAEFASLYAACLDASPAAAAQLQALSPQRAALWQKILHSTHPNPAP